MTTERHVLLLVSGNTFGVDPWADHTADLWRAMAERFDEVHVFARARSQRFVRESRGNLHVHLIPQGPARMMTFFVTSWLLPMVLRRVHPTVVQVQSAVHGGPAVAAFCRRRRIPFMVEIHGEHYLRPGQVGARWHRWFVRPVASATFRRATRIRALSCEMAREIGEVYGPAVGSKVVVIGNRVDLSLFSPPKQDYVLSDPPRLVCVGALNENKNQVGLVENLRALGRRCQLVLVGDGPARQDVLTAAERCGVEVALTGRVSHVELVGLLREADIYVHYSRSEAVSRAVLEAMAMGLPVVGSPGGFLEGILDHGRTGVRLSSLRPEELVAVVEELLGSEDWRRELGTAARQAVEEQHEWNRVFDRHAAELQKL